VTAFSATRTRARSDYRVVLVDQHTLFVDSMQRTLSIEGYDARSVSHLRAGHCPDALLSEVRAMKPRLVLVDLDLGPAVDGLQIITPLARDRVDVVVVTADPDRARWGEAVRGGARKVLSKSRPLQETLAVVRRLHQGLAVQTVGERQELLRARREATVRTHVTAILDTLEVSSQPTAIGLAHASAPFSDPVGKLSQNMPDMRHEPPRVPA
jgi:two-component system nitrate/nitrite response regulator NarL